MKFKNLLHITVTLFLFNFTSYSQDTKLFAGIEIGSKGIKMSIIEMINIKKGDLIIKSYWSENIGIAKGISIDGNLAQADIDRAAQVVNENYLKIKNEYKVVDENIFVVGSSGVAMAKNTKVLIDKIKEVSNKDLDFIDAKTEGKMLMKGCVPPIFYKTSMVLDIGGGNTKGGYIDVRNNDNFIFFPLSLNYGTITLTEAVNKKVRNETTTEFSEKAFGFLPTLRDQVNEMYGKSPVALEKEKVFMSGGAVWAFFTLYNGVAQETFNEFKIEDVIYYDAVLKNNFKRFEDLAKLDKEIDRVLKTYSHKHLMSASNLLLVCLEAIPNVNEKKLYFAKEGQIAWLVSYISEKSKKTKKIY